MMQRNLFISKGLWRAWCNVLIAATLVILFAACGSNSASNTSSSGSTATTPTSSSSNGSGRYGSGGGTTPTTSSSNGGGGTTPTTSSATNLIKTATATVSGSSLTILTNAQGLTLYFRTSDVPPSTVCSGGCAGAWPPLVMSGSGTPKSATSLSGKLTLVADANGKQVEYNGHPLYTYSGDRSPGQTNGEGVGGVWHVCTPSLT